MKEIDGYRPVRLQHKGNFAKEDEETRCQKMLKFFLAASRKAPAMIVDLSTFSWRGQCVDAMVPENRYDTILLTIKDERTEVIALDALPLPEDEVLSEDELHIQTLIDIFTWMTGEQGMEEYPEMDEAFSTICRKHNRVPFRDSELYRKRMDSRIERIRREG